TGDSARAAGSHPEGTRGLYAARPADLPGGLWTRGPQSRRGGARPGTLGAAGETNTVRGARARAHCARGNGERGLVVEHLSQEQLDAMVMGTASGDDQAVRRHLATCEACARRLAREAQFESDLYDAAASPATNVAMARARSVPARMWRVALPVAAALAVVAFAAWTLISREKAEVAPPGATGVGPPSAHAPGPAGPRAPGSGGRE